MVVWVYCYIWGVMGQAAFHCHNLIIKVEDRTLGYRENQ